MRHYYVTGPGRIEVVEEPVPEPGAGEVLVRTAFTALSPGSNVHGFRMGSFYGQGEVVYMGSGVVERVGEGVTQVVAGDRVAMNGIGHQEFGVLPAAKVHKLVETVALRDAAISYLCGWAVSALHLGKYAAGEAVVVVGQGLVGASAALVAEMAGARVLGLDVAPERVAFARGLGLGCVALVETAGRRGGGAAGTDEKIAAYLGVNGADLILEASGAWAGLRTALDLARDYSRIALMGIYRQPPPADLALELFHQAYDFPSKLHYKRLQIIGCGYDPEVISQPMPRMATREGNFAYVLEQAGRGKLPLSKLVTHVVPAEEIAGILERFASGEKSMIGVVFDWSGAQA